MLGYKKRVYGTLKSATMSLIKTCGGLEHAISIKGVRVRKTQLFNYTDHDHADSFITIDQVAAMESWCKKPLVTLQLAKFTNHKLSVMPDKSHDYSPYQTQSTLHKLESNKIYISIVKLCNSISTNLCDIIISKSGIVLCNKTLKEIEELIDMCYLLKTASKHIVSKQYGVSNSNNTGYI